MKKTLALLLVGIMATGLIFASGSQEMEEEGMQ